MRRKPNELLPIEISILAAAVDLRQRGASEFYGFLIAKEIRERVGARLLTAYGTLYKALDRLQGAGLLRSRWEDPLVAADEKRPRRRLYQVTPLGETVLAATPLPAPNRAANLRARPAPP
jgi:DNA-binding PadR family transcriptional regulator